MSQVPIELYPPPQARMGGGGLSIDPKIAFFEILRPTNSVFWPTAVVF